MYATTFHRRTLIATAVLAAAAWFTLAAPAADAAPKPEPQPAAATGCPIDVHEFPAGLLVAGFTGQAANIVTQLTVRECAAAGF